MGKRVAEEEGQRSKLLVEGKQVCRQVGAHLKYKVTVKEEKRKGKVSLN